MIELYEHAKLPTYVIADTHGNFDILKDNIMRYENINSCILIIAGDIGLGFYSYEYYNRVFEKLNNLFIEKHIYCYMLRGNHDDPKYFKEHLINFSNVKSIDDYSIIKVGDENILCVGGGLSIDRKNRIENYKNRIKTQRELLKQYTDDVEDILIKISPSYWEDELPYYDEEKLNLIKENNINIDYVISHTSPSFCFKSDFEGIKYWIKMDESLLGDLKKEREELDKVLSFIKKSQETLKKWVYGHFHEHYDMLYENTRYVALINCDYSFDCHNLIEENSLES